MLNRPIAALLVACQLAIPTSILRAAENQMGYQLLSAEQASSLPKGGGRLGLNVGRGQQIDSGGIAFELLRVNTVAPGSPAAQAGFKPGDQVIAVDGKVFPSVAAFASYVGSKQAAQALSIDYIPNGGGPQEAQRIKVTLGDGYVRDQKGADQQRQGERPEHPGLSTGEKVAIGVGAAALFGCYKAGCFSRKATPNNAR